MQNCDIPIFLCPAGCHSLGPGAAAAAAAAWRSISAPRQLQLRTSICCPASLHREHTLWVWWCAAQPILAQHPPPGPSDAAGVRWQWPAHVVQGWVRAGQGAAQG